MAPCIFGRSLSGQAFCQAHFDYFTWHPGIGWRCNKAGRTLPFGLALGTSYPLEEAKSMSIKLYKNTPPPVQQPPPTFDITGLCAQQLQWLRSLAAARYNTLSAGRANGYLVSGEEEFFRRLTAVILTEPEKAPEKEKK